MTSAEYMAEYRAKNKEKLQAYARKYYAAYRKGDRYSSKDRKEVVKNIVNELILALNEYIYSEKDSKLNSELISTSFDIKKQLNDYADKLAIEEDFL